MHIVFLTKQPFPYGDAEINRQISYAKEIVKMGHKVMFLCLQSHGTSNTNPNNNQTNGCYQGIDFSYTEGSSYWNEKSNVIRKKFLHIKSYINSICYIVRNRKLIDILQIYNGDLQMFYLYSFLSKVFGIPLVQERSEYPDIVKQRDTLITVAKGRRYIRNIEKAFHKFDGWILETQNLADYYMPLSKTTAKYIIAPMTVEYDRFSNVPHNSSKYGKYIAYCGNLREVDGMSILIKSFSMIANKYQDCNLLLAGWSENIESLKELTRELGLQERVVFLGKISRDEVPIFLGNAEILVLASPLSKRASATMPCKVGEYLCTGKPVVVTGQGEIFKYLKDGENAFLAEPDSIESFANKIDEVLSDYSRALMIGKKGAEVPLKYFNSRIQAERIVDFYKTLIYD